MVKQDAYRRSPTGRQSSPRPPFSPWHSPSSLLLATISVTAVLCLVIGLYFLWLKGREPGQGYRASLGILLLLLSACQGKMASCLFRRGGERSAQVITRFWEFAGRMLAGVAICYVLALSVESSTAASRLFIAGLASWYTVLLVPVVFPQIFAGPSRASLKRWLHRSEAATIVCAVLLVAAECGLRLLDWYSGNPLLPTTHLAHLKFAPGTTVRGRAVNRHGYWDEEFAPHTGGKLRVAVLGSDVVLSGDAGTNCLVLLERSLPDVEVYNFGLSRGGPPHYVNQLQEEILPHQPDLVLAFVSIGHDLAVRPAAAPTHDWRDLRVLQFRNRHCTPPFAQAAAGFLDSQRAADYESYLRLTSRRLSICRTPIEPAMKAHCARYDRTIATHRRSLPRTSAHSRPGAGARRFSDFLGTLRSGQPASRPRVAAARPGTPAASPGRIRPAAWLAADRSDAAFTGRLAIPLRPPRVRPERTWPHDRQPGHCRLDRAALRVAPGRAHRRLAVFTCQFAAKFLPESLPASRFDIAFLPHQTGVSVLGLATLDRIERRILDCLVG